MKVYNRKYTLSSVRMHLLYITVKRRYFKYFFFLIVSAILYRLNINSKKIIYHIIGRIWLYVPLHRDPYFILREIFIDDIYKPLIWCKNILDLWAYIWESALYLASHGAWVSAYEMNKNLYALALLNTQNNKFISLHYGAVVGTDISNVSLENTHIYDTAGHIIESSDKKIPTYNIVDIVSNKSFDAIKMDIEWAEYDIIKTLLDKWLFHFHRWIIEFHNIEDRKNNKELDRFIDFLENSWYKWVGWDNYWCHISHSDIKNWNIKFANIYFSK